jgi:hypothetical protein
MFSPTFMESNRAAPWKSIPMRLRMVLTSMWPRLEMGFPSTTTSPPSGCRRPIMCLRITDFPPPEVPMMTMVSPRRISRLTSRSTFWGPKDFSKWRSSMSSFPPMLPQ